MVLSSSYSLLNMVYSFLNRTRGPTTNWKAGGGLAQSENFSNIFDEDINLKGLFEILNPENNLVLADDMMLSDAQGIILLWSSDRLEIAREVDSRITKIYADLVSLEKMMHYKRNIIDVLMDIALAISNLSLDHSR